MKFMSLKLVEKPTKEVAKTFRFLPLFMEYGFVRMESFYHFGKFKEHAKEDKDTWRWTRKGRFIDTRHG